MLKIVLDVLPPPGKFQVNQVNLDFAIRWGSLPVAFYIYAKKRHK